MRLKRLELTGFKSFAKKTVFLFESPITAIVGPNGSGKSNSAEAFRWVLGERSLKSLRGARGEDMIFNGANSSTRANRASVSLIFNNTDRYFNFDFDEVTLTREVYRDGNNVYSVNGTIVRHRDLIELLANASLGASDHYIINQGEADRILTANVVERRALVEDALGLQVYQWKIDESEKKLEQTKNNLEKVASLRREIAPHLRFLKKQVEKIEQADRLRRELKTLYLEYLKREEVYLQDERAAILSHKQEPETELEKIDQELRNKTGVVATTLEDQTRVRDEELELKLRQITQEKDKLNRQLGRLDGLIEIKKEALIKATTEVERDFSFRDVVGLVRELDQEIEMANRLSDIFSLRNVLAKIKDKLKNFLSYGRNSEQDELRSTDLETWENERRGIVADLEKLSSEENNLLETRTKLAEESKIKLETVRAIEHEVFDLKTRRQELLSLITQLESRLSRLELEENNFKRELDEAKVLVDHEVVLYKNFVIKNSESENRDVQEKRRHQLERLKIKLEDLGVESGDTLKEYRDVTERDAFLAKEVTDLEQASVTLREVIEDLRDKIDRDFQEGLVKINEHFQKFFALMFGGGDAGLTIIKEKVEKTERAEEINLISETEQKAGLDININLPRKKVRSLDMLSGGERALVSIALLFALSQVNPPPFLILDETDAALDEANSRKYGDMVESLAKHSQLILITHNRETMSRAGIIYGVTMGNDGMSKLLSIKFDEAAQFAK